MIVPRIYVSALRKSSGKTTISIALSRLISNKYKVLAFKKGPDYIDPMWLKAASKNKCYNLDFFFLGNDTESYFVNKIKSNLPGFCIIEANHGLFDDIYLDGRTSNAQLAKITKTPVLLVIDASEYGRTMIPILKGCIDFDKDLNIAGVILNKIQSKRHEDKLTQAIKYYTTLPVLGVLPYNNKIEIAQRHLGLASTLHEWEKEEIIQIITDHAKPYLDLEDIISIAQKSGILKNLSYEEPITNLRRTIAIAYDRAFNFYYDENLEKLEKNGACLVRFSPLNDKEIPESDVVYIGGGFPELFLKEIEKNFYMRDKIKKLAEDGTPIFAECGGLMYLTRSITFNSESGKMCGVFALDTKLSKKPMGHGYTILSAKDDDSWLGIKKIYGHEFHHGYFTQKDNIKCFFKIERGYGINGKCDGLIYKNIIASFTHMFSVRNFDFLISWLNNL